MLTDRGPKYITAMNGRLMYLLKKNHCRQLLSQHFTVSFKANEQVSEDILTNQLVSLVIERLGSPLLICHLGVAERSLMYFCFTDWALAV